MTVEQIDRWLIWLPVIALFLAPLLSGLVSPGLLEESGSFWETYLATFAWSGGVTVIVFMIERGHHDKLPPAVTVTIIIIAFLASNSVATAIGGTSLALDEAGPEYTGQGPWGFVVNILIWLGLGGWNAFGPIGLALATVVGGWAGLMLARNTTLFQID